VYDCKEDVIPKSIQLIAGRTAKEYNSRKNRTGAFWEDRYHATAVHSGEHSIGCLAYIDLRESPIPYMPLFDFEKCGLSSESSYFAIFSLKFNLIIWPGKDWWSSIIGSIEYDHLHMNRGDTLDLKNFAV
jgi:hypothetical protein